MTFEVTVIGGGLVGWSAAHRIAKSGRSVAVIDRADLGYATAAGAGIVAPGTSLTAAPSFYPLGQAAVDYYDRLIPELAEDGESATGYEKVGMLFIARDDDEWARVPDVLGRMTALRDGGMGNLGSFELIDSQQAQAMFPPLVDVRGAIHITDPARVSAVALRDALRSVAIRNGAVEIQGSARLASKGDVSFRLTVDDNEIATASVIISGGAWSETLGQALGMRLPVHPQRGQIAHFDLPAAETSEWPIVEWFGSHYMLTFGGQRVVVGATREHDSGYDVRVTAAGMQELMNVALGVAPGLAAATVTEVRVGLRPFCQDGLPIIGAAPNLENVWVCTGHGPSGIQLGPVSGAAIAALSAGEAVGFDLTPFSPARFL